MNIERFLASHDGVVSREQARACGLSDDQIRRRVSQGDWLRRAPGVFFARAWAWTAAAQVRVAAEWVRPAGTLVAITAAWWLGFVVAGPYPVTVALPAGRSRKAPHGVMLVQRDLRSDRVRHRGLWVASRPLAVLDAAVALGRDGPAFLDRALQRHVTIEQLRAAQSRHLGRRGSAEAACLLAQASDHAESGPERRMLALLRGAGITGWVANLEHVLMSGRSLRLDVAFPDLRFAIEVDGWAHHVDHDRFVSDRMRKRALVAEGWVVIEVTWDDLVNRPDRVIADIRRILVRRSVA